jgi:hypothetical protein
MKWLESYDERQRKIIGACVNYAEQYPDTGLPGHNLMLIIARMAEQLGKSEEAGQDIPELGPPPGEPATEKQVKYAYFLGSSVGGWDADRVDQACAQLYRGRVPAQLTKTEISTFIDMLKQPAGG